MQNWARIVGFWTGLSKSVNILIEATLFLSLSLYDISLQKNIPTETDGED